ncbi:MAG: oxygen-independent coproporphyrinogen III oxidase [Flavobacteriales bacterium]
MDAKELIQKYNVPGPRYTSYPTVPFWKKNELTSTEWLSELDQAFVKFPDSSIGIYIHLPFCESLCTFCGCHKRITKNHQVETPYIDAVIKEWQLYRQHLPENTRISELHFGGGTPTFFHPMELLRLLNGIFQRAYIDPNDCDLSFEAHPNSTSDEHLQSLFDFGFRRVSFGIQDYNPQVQKAIHRIQTFDEIQHVHLQSKKIGYTSINHDLVYGLPHQSLEGFEQTIDYTIQLKPERIALYGYAHVPWIKGTGQRGYDEQDLPKDSEKRALYEMACEKLMAHGYLAIGMDHFALPEDHLAIAFNEKKLHRNFMGYTTQSTKFLIGLGMSAISDSWTGFAQNDKSVEGYQEQINRGELAVFRGHLLSALELEIRSYILDLMCHFETQFRNDSMYQETHAFIQQKLAPLEADGIVRIEGNNVIITEVGSPFVRNVCMAFDLDLHNYAGTKPLFSATV